VNFDFFKPLRKSPMVPPSKADSSRREVVGLVAAVIAGAVGLVRLAFHVLKQPSAVITGLVLLRMSLPCGVVTPARVAAAEVHHLRGARGNRPAAARVAKPDDAQKVNQ
jgi:hypothetical protein